MEEIDQDIWNLFASECNRSKGCTEQPPTITSMDVQYHGYDVSNQ